MKPNDLPQTQARRRRHFACSRCLTSFENAKELEAHEEETLVFACSPSPERLQEHLGEAADDLIGIYGSLP